MKYEQWLINNKQKQMRLLYKEIITHLKAYSELANICKNSGILYELLVTLYITPLGLFDQILQCQHHESFLSILLSLNDIKETATDLLNNLNAVLISNDNLRNMGNDSIWAKPSIPRNSEEQKLLACINTAKDITTSLIEIIDRFMYYHRLVLNIKNTLPKVCPYLGYDSKYEKLVLSWVNNLTDENKTYIDLFINYWMNQVTFEELLPYPKVFNLVKRIRNEQNVAYTKYKEIMYN